VLSVEAFDPASSGDGPVEDVTVELGARPDDPDSAFLGVALSDQAEPVDDLGFTVDIDSGSVGGPSAGLAFTLAILDALTAGELTGGATVAVTGTIDVAGRVGAVGGVVQKAAAVRDMGADLFIVPAGLPEGELAEVMDRAGDDLKVVPVDDLEQALAALAQVGGEVAAVEEFAASNLSQQSS
jgi:PDZ domain-containing protein